MHYVYGDLYGSILKPVGLHRVNTKKIRIGKIVAYSKISIHVTYYYQTIP